MSEEKTPREEQIMRLSLENDVDTGAMTAISIYVVIFLYAMGSSWDLTVKIAVSFVSIIAVTLIFHEYHQKMKKIDTLFKN